MNLLSTLIGAGLLAGLTIGALQGVGEAVEKTTPALHNVVSYQEAVVATAEACDMEAAPAIRAEWEAKKPIVNAHILELEQLAQGIKDAVTSHPDAAATNGASTLFN